MWDFTEMRILISYFCITSECIPKTANVVIQRVNGGKKGHTQF